MGKIGGHRQCQARVWIDGGGLTPGVRLRVNLEGGRQCNFQRIPETHLSDFIKIFKNFASRALTKE